ncbi:MAG: hypothetical protein R3F42_11985 [Pseudomonadota bacterium]
MRTFLMLACGVLLASSLCWAQEPNPYSGSWQAHLVNNKGEQRKGKVVLGETDGNWDFEHQVYKNPCVGMPAPIVIRSATADALVFEIDRSRVLKGCKNNVATLQRIDDNTLQGGLDDGRKLTLIRE